MDLHVLCIHTAYFLSSLCWFVMYTYKFLRRRMFVPRCAAAISVLVCVTLFVPEDIGGVYLYTSFNALSVFADIIFSIKFLYDVSWKSAISVAIGISLSQQAGVQLYRMLAVLFVSDPIPFSEMALPFIGRWDYKICYFVGEIAMYLIVYFSFLRRSKTALTDNLKSRQVIIFAACALLIVYMVGDYVNRNEMSNQIIYIIPTYAACLALLYGLFVSCENNRLRSEEKIMKKLYADEQIHYDALKSDIDTINRRCHDLKYQAEALRNASADERIAFAEELSRDIINYENLVQTGNIALDDIISEKYTMCVDSDISFNRNIDGKVLSFMQTTDIYVLFGNALDNAIECVKKYTEKEKRRVAVYLKHIGSIIKIHIENYCEDEVKMGEGVLRTSKADKSQHGYGTRSIRYIVKKYGGHCVFSNKREENLFCLDIIFQREKDNGKPGEAH